MQQEDLRYHRLDRVLARAYVELMHRWKAAKKWLETGFLVPRMDLCNDLENTHIVARLEVPGMRHEELRLQVKDSHLIIEGEHVGPHLQSLRLTSTPLSLYLVRKLKYGKIKHEIDLPAGVDIMQVHSTLAEGILTVLWPRTAISPMEGGVSIGHVITHSE